MLKNVTATLIAGGKSRRFGSSKVFALYNESRLIDCALNVARQISDDVLVIGNFDQQELKTTYPVYNDIITGCGPLCGIHAALNYAQKNYVAVLPVDMPELSVDIYRFLYPSLNDQQPVVAVSHKGIEPLVSIWPKTQLGNFEQAIADKEFRLHKILKKLDAKEIELSAIMPGYQEKWFENINYKKDLDLLTTFLENKTKQTKEPID